ncbi:hypothetical protein LTR35_005905 [Friedmanniomyces endolithicus]|uniref:MARVEL domain-containing protein n=1 Tax=Friedmanniomyces endolithicus TaxID=329885 RepID=A0AAN6G1V8_9PEZI|nr:hypothetical protein LTR35_005905 [Friedmanniomyces endolithicus]KAK0300696.1 hypothetical protein LTS00_000953 [Friedmanniomyces endolithicus]KAK0328258.1 hypothetical protein LTR82_000187 [Friedmanniomyces endolithicus]KAK1018098.1 hypothetical protein LTR54_001945 [Friedmanniomyces endolithicus]
MIGNLIARAFQLLCGAVVLGLSISAIKWQYFGAAPATTSYSAFAGAFGVLAALIGIAASFVEAIPEVIMVGVDGLAAMLLLAGGLAFAIGLKGVTCNNDESTAESSLLNGGSITSGTDTLYGFPTTNYHAVLSGRCRTAEADSAFLFLGFLASLAAAVLCFLASKRGGRGVKSSAV